MRVEVQLNILKGSKMQKRKIEKTNKLLWRTVFYKNLCLLILLDKLSLILLP